MAFKYGQLTEQVVTTATAAGTTTLTNISKQNQVFTGTSSQIIVLPDATTMSVGQGFNIINQSALSLTLQFNGGSAFTDASGIAYGTIYPHQALEILLQTNSGGSPQPGTWIVSTNNAAGLSLIQPTVQKFLTGNGTYTTPANVAYIQIEMVGQGGGGGGGGTSGGIGGTGTSSTFGSSLLTTAGGIGGGSSSNSGLGGTATVNSPAIQITAVSGGSGGAGAAANVSSFFFGGAGGNSALGGAGSAGSGGSPGAAGVANTGGGGGGGGSGGAVNIPTGSGGGAGGYLKALIMNPSATYSYVVGIGSGGGGGAGTNGSIGGVGGTGAIIVTEYYNQTIASGVTVTASTAPTKQVFLSGSGTYNRPSGVQYISVRMVGGGGGGSSAGSSALVAAGAGGNSTFGLCTALGGSPAVIASGPGAGGTATLGTGWNGVNLSGANGNTGSTAGTGFFMAAPGADSALGGGGSAGGASSQAGGTGVANTGGGGGGGGSGATTGVNNGSSGGAGGYIEATLSNPATTYSYSVGVAGIAGTHASLASGGAGGSGIIEVTEYYTALATGGFAAGGANVPTIQKFLTGSGTYTTPSNVTWIQVRMVGGGGGGGAGNATGASGNGSATTFGSSLLSAGGGLGGGGGGNGTFIGTGGTGSLGSGPIGFTLPGGIGSLGPTQGDGNAYSAGGIGGSTPLGAGGVPGAGSQATPATIANTGEGGGGGGCNVSGTNGGAGGGAGAYVEAIITNPLSTYAYSVGTGGTAQAAGTNGFVGAIGSSGIIIVTEYYANGTVGSATNVTGIVQPANGGTGSATPFGTISSTQVATTSSTVTSTTFVNLSNSPTLTFTPTVTGHYKVYANIPMQQLSGGFSTRINNTTGSATLITQQNAVCGGALSSDGVFSMYAEATYALTAGTSYSFDYQARTISAYGSGSCQSVGAYESFGIIAEKCI